MLMLRALLLALLLAGGVAAPAGALGVDPPLADPALERRAEALHHELRCLVCQNQSIAESNAELARDLRQLVRERLLAGDSDQQARDFIVARYGDWVLLDPPFKRSTLVLWLGPLLLLLLAGALVRLWLSRNAARAAGEARPLGEEERRRLKALLQDGEGA